MNIENFIRLFIEPRWQQASDSHDWAILCGMLHGACLITEKDSADIRDLMLLDDIAFIHFQDERLKELKVRTATFWRNIDQVMRHEQA